EGGGDRGHRARDDIERVSRGRRRKLGDGPANQGQKQRARRRLDAERGGSQGIAARVPPRDRRVCGQPEDREGEDEDSQGSPSGHGDKNLSPKPSTRQSFVF